MQPPTTSEPDLDLDVDKLQPWSRIKHEILEKYLGAYTTILSKQTYIRRYVYIDAFAGAGVALDEEADEYVKAGALRALEATPAFSEYHFIELDANKAAMLRRLTDDDPRVTVHDRDYHAVLPRLLDERCRYEDFARGLCLLDPYGLSVDYEMLNTIAGMQSVEIFFNFMLVSANRNVLWHNAEQVTPARKKMMTRVWGHDRWPDELYDQELNLFGEDLRKKPNEAVVEAYRKRLKAIFPFVPQPIAMRTRSNAPLYYLFFCGHNATGAKIVTDIFDRYR